MSVYASGVAAYRDTTKWLAAFVPVTALVSAAVLLGPDLIVSVRTSPSLSDWLCNHWLVFASGLALFAAVGAILYFGALVLSVEPVEIAKLQKLDAGGDIARAIGSGAAAPEFFGVPDFRKVMSEVANRFDSEDPRLRPAVDDPDVARVRLAVEALRQWSVFSQIQKPFRNFQIAFAVSSLLIVAALVAAPMQLSSSGVITKPTPVLIEVDVEGAKSLTSATRCDGAAAATFTAVGGTWERPELAVDGPGCDFHATWLPDPQHIELRLAAP